MKIVLAGQLQIGTQIAEADGFLFEVEEIIRQTPKTITVRLCSDFSNMELHWTKRKDGKPGGIIKTFRKTTELCSV